MDLLRGLAALLLGAVPIIVVTAELLPTATALGPGRWLVWAGLIAAALVLPRPRRVTTTWTAHPVALALGLLLLCEPVLQVVLLTTLATWPGPSGLDLVLPPAGGVVAPAALLGWVVMPALVEEWCFRGRLQPWLQGRIGPWPGLIVTSAAFAVAHGPGPAVLAAFLVGLLVGLVRWRTGSTYAAVAAHAAHNLLVLLTAGAVIASPRNALLLWLAGAGLVALARFHGRGPALPARRLVAALLLSWALLIAAHVPLRLAKDRLWAMATSAVVCRGGVPLPQATTRLEALLATRTIDGRRQAALVQELGRQPSPGPWLAATVDPLAVLATTPATAAYEHLRQFAACPWPSRGLSTTIAILARRDPLATALLLGEDPGLLALHLPLPTHADTHQALLTAATGRTRWMLFHGLRLAFGNDAAARSLLALPPQAVGPRERRLLRLATDDWPLLVEELPASRQAAWR